MGGSGIPVGQRTDSMDYRRCPAPLQTRPQSPARIADFWGSSKSPHWWHDSIEYLNLKDVPVIDIVSIQRQNYANRFTHKSLSARYSQSLQNEIIFIYALSPSHSSTCPEIHINIFSFPQHFLPIAPIFIIAMLRVAQRSILI